MVMMRAPPSLRFVKVHSALSSERDEILSLALE